MDTHVYRWENALQDFHDPHHYITPLVELPQVLNPYVEQGIHIYAKLLYMNPLLNVKSLPARYMVQDARSRQSDITHFVESSSGNTAYSIGVYGKVYHQADTTAIVSTEVTEWKKKILELMWLDLHYHQEPICPDPSDPDSSINLARQLWKQSWWYNPGQYDNPLNWESHYDITWPQIYEQLPEIDVLVTSLWTTGILIGSAKYLKEKNNHLKVIGTVRKENNPIPWPRTEWLLEHVAFDWRSYVDELMKVSRDDAYAKSKILCQYGLLWWPSTGMQYHAALEYASSCAWNEQDIHIVFTCPDTVLPYLYEYDTWSSSSWIWYTAQQLLENINDHKKLSIVDLRGKEQFDEYHIDVAESLPFQYVDEFMETSLQQGYTYVFICAYGSKSEIIANYVRSLWYEAYSLQWGIVEWYNKWYPVCKSKSCIHQQN